jgi:hypothetical protein
MALKVSKNDVLAKKGRCDYFSTNLKVALANANPKSKFCNKYIKSTFCGKVLEKKGDKVTGLYCNQRWCVTCNRIRTSKLITQYLPEVKKIENLYFVTLTLRNCKEKDLRKTVKWMISTWSKIQKKIVRKEKIKGFRKLEVTYNQKFNDYHPHFHAIINGENNSKKIIEQWISECKENNISVDSKWQNYKPADLNSIKELFKYTTKILPSKKKNQTWESIYKNQNITKQLLISQDIIYRSLEMVRCFQPFGIKIKKEDIESELTELVSQEIATNKPDGTYFRDKNGNWEHIFYDIKLHDTKLSENLINIVKLMCGSYIQVRI